MFELKKYKCPSFKRKYDKYPSSVYKGITDDPDSWGMCCSKEMAYKCAEDYYDIYIRVKFKIKYVVYAIGVILLLIFIVFMS